MINMDEPGTRFVSISENKKIFAIDSPFEITEYDHHSGENEIIKNVKKKSTYELHNIDKHTLLEKEIYIKYETVEDQSERKQPVNGSLFKKENLHFNDDVGSQGKIKVFKRRWYILFVYCILAFTQSTLWNTWGPIAQTSESALGWTDGDVALLTNLGPITFLLVVFLISWIVDTKGLRWACLLTGFVILLGAAVRCVTSQPSYLKITACIGQFVNGIGAPVAGGVPPVLSAAWFPPHQRTLATAIASMLNIAGIAASFVIGPFMVPDTKVKGREDTTALSVINITNRSSSSYAPIIYTDNSSTIASETDHSTRERQRNDIMNLLYVECGLAAFVFLLVCVYFPAKPPLPPSASAGIARMGFKSGGKALLKSRVFWVIACSYGFSLGFLGGWPGLLDIVLKPHGISETEAGMVGFYSVVGGIVCALVVSKLTDIFTKHKKRFLLGLYCTSAASLIWMNLILSNLIPGTPATLTAVIVIGAAMLTATTPVYFEMACENTYPVAEGITSFVLALVSNVTSVVFLAIQMIPGIGTSWEGWCLLGAVILCLPGLIFMNEKTNRLNVDEKSQADNNIHVCKIN